MFSWQTKLYQRFTMTTAVDKWPAYARLLMVARRATYPPLLHHSGGHDLYARAPQHVMNLQNWAVAYFYVGRYAESWEKIKLAEAAPRSKELDKRFIAALESKMPRQ
jgi:hypothetical protein